MKDLVTTDGKEIFTTSEVIAEGLGLEHRAILQLIKTHKEDIASLEDYAFEMRIRKGKTQKVTYYNLSEQQASFLILLTRNSKKTVKFKKNLIKEFYRQRKLLETLLTSPDRQQVRNDGKAIYHQSRDVIKIFVEYAESQGSKSAKLYYMNLAKMENKALFILEQKYPNVRDVLSIGQLFQVKVADQIIEKALKDGMDKKLHYKDIYKLAKERVTIVAELTGKSPILSLSKL